MPTPEKLRALLAVPSATAERPEMFGFGSAGIYKFDDPLGVATLFWRSPRSRIYRVGTAPGRILVWLDTHEWPLVLDAASGRPTEDWAAPTLHVTFLDKQRGAAIFVGSGLSVTTDGGSTWRVVEHARPLATTIQRIEDTLYSDKRLIDLSSATLRAEPYNPDAVAQPRERWISEMGAAETDPLEQTLLRGAEVTDRSVIIPVQGGLARVDLATGLGVVESRHERLSQWCDGLRSGRFGWFSCSLEGQPDSKILLRATLDGPPALEQVFSGEWAQPYGTSRGGLALSSCKKDMATGSCVLQPDGSFQFVDVPSRAGASVDGAVYSVDAAAPGSPEISVVAYYPSGEQRVRAKFTLPQPVSRFSSLDEDPDKTLHLVLGAAQLLYSVHVSPEGVPTIVPLNGVGFAEFRGGHGYGTSSAGAISSSNGVSWQVTSPAPTLLAQGTGTGDLSVRSFGVRDGNMLRFHWGPDEPSSQPEETVDVPETDPIPPRAVIACKEGKAFKQVKGPKTAVADADPGIRTESHRIRNETGHFLYEEWGPIDAAAPTFWRVTWVKAAELGGQEHTWSGRSTVSSWSKSGGMASAQGGRVVFSVNYPDAVRLFRKDASGRQEIRDIQKDLAPTTSFSFGEDAEDTLLWLSGTGINAWPRGQEPRRIAPIQPNRDMRVAGATRERGALAYTRWKDRVLITEAALAPSKPVARVALLDWQTMADPFAAGAQPAVCASRERGPRMHWRSEPHFRVQLGDKYLDAALASYELRLVGTGYCIESGYWELQTGPYTRYIRLNFQRRLGETGFVDSNGPKPAIAPITCAGL